VKTAAPIFFRSSAEWRAWLELNHDQELELLVGFYKTATGKPTLTWSESVDEALCFGWIDGVRRRIDDSRYSIRFTPRKQGSAWSRINLAKVKASTAVGKMRPAGMAKYDQRRLDKQAIYSFEQAKVEFDEEFARVFSGHRRAWEFFQNQAPSYRKRATWWVMSAVKAETRAARLQRLMEISGQRRAL